MGKSTVHVIDTRYVQPEFAAAFLIVNGEGKAARGCVVETNTTRAVPHLLAAIGASGLNREQVDYIIVTHVHLDHAGGAGELLTHLPNAKLLVHPRGKRHLVDPGRLESAVRAVYGDPRFDLLYGSLKPVPESRVESVEDGETRSLGGDTLRFFHVRGHANHHFAVELKSTRAVFTGDAFGLNYPEVTTLLMQAGMKPSAAWGLVSTSPSDFDGALAEVAIARILENNPPEVFLTHFGQLKSPKLSAPCLLEQLKAATDWVRELRQNPDEKAVIHLSEKWRHLIEAQWKRLGVRLDAPELARAFEILALDIELNAQGLLAASTRMA